MLKPLVLVLGLAGVLSAQAAHSCSKPGGAGGIEQALVDWINAQRADKGLKRLSLNGKLDGAAASHACDMADKGYFSHTTPSGKSFQSRIKASGYKMRTAVENIAKSSNASADTAAGIWRDSSQHWDNILNPALRDIGVGVATDGSKVYYVFIGGAPK